MNNKPLVSIIMNCYNGELYLKKALESVLSQTYTNWELIFWDNQSQDKSEKIYYSQKVLPIIETFCVYDNTKCMARTKTDITKQCSSKKKFGDYCGKHKDCSIYRIDKPLPSSERKVLIKIKKPKRKPQLISLKRFKRDKTVNKFLVSDIKLTLQFLKIPYTKSSKKPELFSILTKYYNTYIYYKKNEASVVIVQKLIRKYLKHKDLLERGPALFVRNICENEEDIATCVPVKDIPHSSFFSFIEDGRVFGFDMRSFYQLAKTSKDNPYTTKPIPNKVWNRFFDLFNRKTPPKKVSLLALTLDQRIELETLRVFQKIDQLDHYTDIKWFLDLSSPQLRKMYKLAEDIWNYRAQLSVQAKKRIIPSVIAFDIPLFKMCSFSKYRLRKTLLYEMDRFVSLGVTREDRVLGAMYMLTALVDVSYDAAAAMPHLIQL